MSAEFLPDPPLNGTESRALAILCEAEACATHCPEDGNAEAERVYLMYMAAGLMDIPEESLFDLVQRAGEASYEMKEVMMACLCEWMRHSVREFPEELVSDAWDIFVGLLCAPELHVVEDAIWGLTELMAEGGVRDIGDITLLGELEERVIEIGSSQTYTLFDEFRAYFLEADEYGIIEMDVIDSSGHSK